MLDNLLVPVEQQEHSKQAAEYAATIAEPFDATVHALHVVESTPNRLNVETAVEISDYESDEWFAPIASRSQIDTQTQVRAGVVTGNPSDEILKYTRRWSIDLILMESLEFGDNGGLFSTSTTERVMEESPVPVVVIPDNESET